MIALLITIPKKNLNKDTLRPLYDQTHELKIVGLINIGRFYCSSNYIWGSVFPIYNTLETQIESEPDYSRLNASIVYKMKRKKIKTEFGLMFLNVFDQKDINYFGSEIVKIEQETILSVNEKMIAFSVRLFLEIGLLYVS